MQQICTSLSSGNTVFKLNEGENCKILLGILMQVLMGVQTNSLWEFKCNLTCLLNLPINIGTNHMPNMKTCSVYHWNQNRNKAENKCSSLQQRYLFTFLFDYKALFLCVKDRACLRMAIPVYCFNIFGSILGLFCLLIKKLIFIACKTIWQSMRKFL